LPGRIKARRLARDRSRAQILELQARSKTMISLEMSIARTPAGMNLLEVHQAPTKEPEVQSGRSYMEGSEPPISAVLQIRDEHPGVVLEVLSIGRLNGSALVSAIAPHTDTCQRRVVPIRLAVVGAFVVGCSLTGLLLVVGIVGSVVVLCLALLVGSGGALGTKRLLGWAFPHTELLPDSTTKTPWQKTLRVLAGFASAVVGAAGILGLILTWASTRARRSGTARCVLQRGRGKRWGLRMRSRKSERSAPFAGRQVRSPSYGRSHG
jgi:hypothetical protein